MDEVRVGPAGRYILFHGLCYYPQGGFDDAVRRSDDLESLIAIGRAYLVENKRSYVGEPWAHILDLESGELIWKEM